MYILESNRELIYDAFDERKKAIIQIRMYPLIKLNELKKYQINIEYFKVNIDETGFRTYELLRVREPKFLTYLEVDNQRIEFKGGDQVTSEEEDVLSEQILISENSINPPFLRVTK